ncbi:MAG TPA: MFS transporter [Pseudomonadales bacterium]|nr:MFS transporter [Pseudomonadales bacterium]
MAQTPMPETSIRRVALTSLASASIEWYDFYIYGTAAALVFPKVFFPADMPPLVALIASFSTFAVGFFARPVGGILFGHFGDRVGRKRTLVTALLIMGAGTTLIGCLPTYAAVGPLAPILLIVLRFVQGLAIGGQWGGAMLLATESAPKNRRGYYGAFAQAGAPAGVILANLAFLTVNETVSADAFMTWGWRIPFILSIALIGLSLYVQLRLEETSAFRQLRDADAGPLTRSAAGARSPVLEALRLYPRQIALAAGAFIAVQVTYYLLITWVIAYGTNPAGLDLPRSTMLTGVMIGAIAMAPSLLISGIVSDRYGRRGIYAAGAVLLGFWAFAMFPLIDTGSLLWIGVAIGVGQVFVAMMYGPQAAFLTEMFSTHVRYSGASLGYQFGAIFGGALAPIIATELLARTGSTIAISWYVAIACTITAISVALLHETRHVDLHADACAGVPE